MPMYEYICKTCQKRHEIFLRRFIKDKEKTRPCPHCQKTAVLDTPKTFHFQIRGYCYTNENTHDKHLQEAKQAMNEPLTKDEIQALPEIAKEEEKRRGLAPGSILGKPENISPPTEDEADIKSVQAKKKELAKKAREQHKKVEKFKSRSRFKI